MDYLRSISRNPLSLLIIPAGKYAQVSRELAVEIPRQTKNRVSYITLNKTADSLIELYSNQGVDAQGIFFIDAITNTVKHLPERANVIYLPGPYALIDFQQAIDLVIEDFPGNVTFLFDSLSNLIIYGHVQHNIIDFTLQLTAKLKEERCQAVFTCLAQDFENRLIQEVCMSVDEVITLPD